MSACPRCSAPNKPGARFCGKCGTALPPACPRCGGAVKPGARFCGQCGQKIGATPQPTPPRAPPPRLLPQTAGGPVGPGTLLQGRYRIVRALGQGGMGQVYLADDTHLTGKQWAVKEMTEDPGASQADRQMALANFAREAELLATLDHRCLPKVTDHFDEGAKHYLVMEYVQGDSLDKLLKNSPRGLPEDKVRAILGDLCDALEYLHSRTPPVIFRDMKPANVMLQPDGRARLIDFGIARVFQAGKTKDTHLLGTLGYHAPEQAGRGQSDARSDIYALGATVHHLLSGRDPSGDPNNFKPLRTLNPAISAAMEQAVARALEMQAAARWQRAADFADAAGCKTGGAGGAPAPGRSPASPPAPTVAAGGPALPARPAQSGQPAPTAQASGLPYVGLPGAPPDSQPLGQPSGQPFGLLVPQPGTFHRAPWRGALLGAAGAGAAAWLGGMLLPDSWTGSLFVIVAMCAAYLFTHRPGAALLAAAVVSGLNIATYSAQSGYFDLAGLLILLLVPGAPFEALLALHRWKARNPFWLWLCGLAAMWVAGLLGMYWGYGDDFVSWLLALAAVVAVWAISNRVNRRTGVGLPEQVII